MMMTYSAGLQLISERPLTPSATAGIVDSMKPVSIMVAELIEVIEKSLSEL
jgi:hypothetical protein